MKQVIFKPKSFADYTAIVCHADTIRMRVHPYIRKCCNTKEWRSRSAFYVDNGRLMNSHSGTEVSLKEFKAGMVDCVKNNKPTIVLPKPVVKVAAKTTKPKMIELPKELIVEFALMKYNESVEQALRYAEMCRTAYNSDNTITVTIQ